MSSIKCKKNELFLNYFSAVINYYIDVHDTQDVQFGKINKHKETSEKG